MRDYKFWIFVCLIGLVMSVTVRLIAEAASSESKKVEFIEGQLSVLNDRMIKIESKTHPATSKRFDSDDAAKLEERIAKCVDEKMPMRQCLLAMKRVQEQR